MKKFKQLLIVFLMVVLFIPYKATSALSVNGWVINEYKTTLTVSETGLVHIKTELSVNFDYNKHGINVSLPTNYNMKWRLNGESVNKSYTFPISNIEVENHPYEVSHEFDGFNIRIGDEDVYLNGAQSFIYSYDVQMRDLDLDGLQMFYWNIVGSGWDTYVEKTSFSIILPTSLSSSLNQDQIHFYPPTSSSTEVDYTIDQNTISGLYNEVLRPGEALTVMVDLPNQTFTFPVASNMPYYLIILFLAIALVLLVYFFFIYGKDDPIIETVEFTAPEGLSSAQASYVLNGEVNHKSITSLIIYWGAKGYLSIEVNEDESLTLKRLQSIPDEEIKAERSLFNALFKNSDEVNSKHLGESFGTKVQSASSAIPLNFKRGPQALFVAKATRVKWTSIFLISLFFSTFVSYAAYSYYHYFLFAAIAFAITLVLTILIYVITSSSTEYSKSKSTVSKSAVTFGKGIVIVFYLAAMIIIAWFTKMNLILFIIALVILMLTLPPVSFMLKRTEYGREIYGRMLGFRKFIELAEKDRLEMLVAEDPHYFFNILPYAYALGVTSVWISKFEHIAMTPPEWIGGTNVNLGTYMYLNALNRSFNSLNDSVIQSIPEVKSGDGGGSFGGGGGGGFSGGGFGGGGGSSW